MDGHQEAINRTKALEALSPYLENPQQIVIRNEAFVIVAAVILFLQLMLGPWRRRSGHWLVQGTLWVAYTASFPLITYTLGQMVTSPVKNMLYPVWAVILLWAAGCANTVMAYNIEDNRRWKRYLFELLQYFVYTVVIFRLLRPATSTSLQPIFTPLISLTSVVFTDNVLRVVAGWRVTNSTPSKLVADYMRAQVQVNTRSMGGLFLIVYPPIVYTFNPIIEVGTRRVDVTVTVLIMGALLLFEVLQAMLYLTSDWANVSLACSYIRGGACKLISSIIQFPRRLKFDTCLGRRTNFFGYWQNKMGQSSVIGGNLLLNWLNLGHAREDMVFVRLTLWVARYCLDLISSMIFSMKTFVAVPDLVKSEIISCLQIYSKVGGPLTNGKSALERNGVLGDLSSTLQNDSQIKVMLIWHIATEYCNIASSDGAEGLQLHTGAQQVAATLSKYCAYLMYFLPELLAENSTDTLFIVHDLLEKVKSALSGDKPTRHRLLRIIQDSESSRSNQDQTVVNDSDGPDNHATIIHIPPVSSNTDNIVHDTSGGSDNNDHTTGAQDSATNNIEDSILIKGLKLGRDLEAKDVDLRWKVMAEFWAETIIYIAPSDKAAEHMERLAQGGEFLTRIWALLTHAGIVKRDHMIPAPDQTPSSEDHV